MELHEVKTFSQYKPWSGAIPWWAWFTSHASIEKIEAAVSQLYDMDEYITDDELNNLVWFEPATLAEALDLSEEFREEYNGRGRK